MSRFSLLQLSLSPLFFFGLASAQADIVAPQAPPELSDTLKDFRTKEQLSEHVYIEGKIDSEISLQVGTTVGDLEGRVLRLSASYQPQYVLAVPHHGVSLIRFYDLHGMPLEVLSTRVEHPSFQAEVTASPSELLVRQIQDGPSSLLQVRLKGVNQNLIFRLKSLMLVNQQHSVRTLITAMTVNYYMEAPTTPVSLADLWKSQAVPLAPEKEKYKDVNAEDLRQQILHSAALVMPLNLKEQEQGQELMLQNQEQNDTSLKPQAVPTVLKKE